MFADMVVTNDRRTDYRQQRTERIPFTDFMPTDQVINQRHIQRRHHRKQQEFRHRQVKISLKTDEIHDAKLHRAHRHVHQQGFYRIPFPAQKRQKHQRRQAQTDQYREYAVDLSGEIDADQAEGEGP